MLDPAILLMVDPTTPETPPDPPILTPDPAMVTPEPAIIVTPEAPTAPVVIPEGGL